MLFEDTKDICRDTTETDSEFFTGLFFVGSFSYQREVFKLAKDALGDVSIAS